MSMTKGSSEKKLEAHADMAQIGTEHCKESDHQA
jgi:hypothetical protein